jgi:hypothetical protein
MPSTNRLACLVEQAVEPPQLGPPGELRVKGLLLYLAVDALK